ncbi:hypothetical protein [Rhodococcus globerulus]|uniref:hypothetical protein n=1 Tax=Rhodococcus globerulus TaxID=33008 RepID=UPI001F45A76F|nr:hypothetical protein [Rhodococcus globerulus]MCE4265520.1 hypothetical protein [Rhodococcus globerulus]
MLGIFPIAALVGVAVAKRKTTERHRNPLPFFDSPERVLDELARRCMIDSYGLITRQFTNRSRTTWTEIVDILVGHYRQQTQFH